MPSNQTIADRLQFLKERIPVYQAAPANFGVTAAALTQLDNAYKAADGAYQAALDARAAAKKATQMQEDALRLMGTQQSNVLRSIKTFADNKPTVAERNAVYAAALLPVPQPPSSLPAPSTPTSVSADPNANGTVTVRWKASGNAGAVYTVWRKLAGNSQFTQVGLVAKKSFIDTTVPAGTTSCQYQVQAVRGTQMSTATQPVTVQFGTGGAVGFQSGQLGLAA
ncbi:MAG: fibronectin type III domain-containing protein [Phycisphaerales bacterium]|nr:fibronectin type III domain-containing protein [Phycisphaerales bacterium]